MGWDGWDGGTWSGALERSELVSVGNGKCAIVPSFSPSPSQTTFLSLLSFLLPLASFYFFRFSFSPLEHLFHFLSHFLCIFIFIFRFIFYILFPDLLALTFCSYLTLIAFRRLSSFCLLLKSSRN